MNKKPIYLTTSEIGRTLGRDPRNMVALIRQWETDPEHPTPTPDAYAKIKNGYLNPLWLPTRIPEWKAWDSKRIVLGRQRQSRGGKKSKPTQNNQIQEQPQTT